MPPIQPRKPTGELSTAEKVDAIYNYLKGDPLDPDDRGLIGSHRALKSRVVKLEKFRDRSVALFMGAAAVSSTCTAVVVYLLNRK